MTFNTVIVDPIRIGNQRDADPAAIEYVQRKSLGTTSASTLSTTTVSPMTVGNLLVAITLSRFALPTNPSTSADWNFAGRVKTNFGQIDAWWKVCDGTEDDSFSVTGYFSPGALYLFEFSTVDAISGCVTQDDTGDTGLTCAVGPVTLPERGLLISACCFADDDFTGVTADVADDDIERSGSRTDTTYGYYIDVAYSVDVAKGDHTVTFTAAGAPAEERFGLIMAFNKYA